MIMPETIGDPMPRIVVDTRNTPMKREKDGEKGIDDYDDRIPN